MDKKIEKVPNKSKSVSWSLLPISTVSIFYGLSSISSLLDDSSRTTKVKVYAHRIYKCVAALFYFTALIISSLLANLKIYTDVGVPAVMAYVAVGNNLCTSVFSFIVFSLIFTTWIKSKYLNRFYENAAEIDSILKELNQRIAYRVNFSINLIAIIVSLMGCIVEHVLLVPKMMFNSEGSVQDSNSITIVLIAVLSVLVYGYVTKLLIFISHMREITIRFKHVNSSLVR